MDQLLKPAQSRYRYSLILLRQLVITDFKLRYHDSALGYLWSLLKPLAIFSILYVVFVRFIGLGSDIPYFAVYLLLGVVIWSFFTEVTGQAIGSIVGRGDLLRKLNFPRYVIVLSSAISGLINLFINLLVVAAFMVWQHVPLTANIVWVPLLILELFIFAVGVGFFLSAMFVRFRDLQHIWDIILQGAFYATPILYPLSLIPDQYAKWLLLNPAAQIIQDLRYVLISTKSETVTHLWGTPWVHAIPIGLTVLIAIGAFNHFRKRSRYFAEEV